MITLPHILWTPEWTVSPFWLIFGVGELWLTILVMPFVLAFAGIAALFGGASNGER